MKELYVSRFKREMTSIIRRKETVIMIEKKTGKKVVWMPVEDYEELMEKATPNKS